MLVSNNTSHNPATTTANTLHCDSLGSSQFARHYYGNLLRFLFLELLRYFTSLAYHLHTEYLLIADGLPHSEIHNYNGYWYLVVTFRNQLRPSSAFLPKESILCF